MKALRLDVAGLAFVTIWSSGYVVGALATQQIAPLAVTLWRFAIAATILALIAVRRGERFPRGRELWQLVGVGIPMFAVQFGALYEALAEGLPAGTTALIACSTPLAVAAVSAVVGWERLTTGQWAGVGLGVLGVAITLSDRVGRPPSVATLMWALLGLSGLVCGTVLQGRLRVRSGPAATVATQVGASAAVLAVWAPLRGPVSIPLTAHALGSFAWLALVTGVGATLLFFALIRERGATRASSLLFPVPAVTVVASWPILGTPVGPGAVGGIVVVAGALWLLRRRKEPAAVAEPVRDKVAA